MLTRQTLALVKRMRQGDRAAWNELISRHYPMWLKMFHGKLGADLRKLCGTEDILQSAFAQALGDIDRLKNDHAFFAWFGAVVRRKIAGKRRKLQRSPPAVAAGVEDAADSAREDKLDVLLDNEQQYLRLLDSLLGLFPLYPDHMALFYLRHFEDVSIAGLVGVIGRKKETVHKILRHAKQLLQSKLNAERAGT